MTVDVKKKVQGVFKRGNYVRVLEGPAAGKEGLIVSTDHTRKDHLYFLVKSSKDADEDMIVYGRFKSTEIERIQRMGQRMRG